MPAAEMGRVVLLHLFLPCHIPLSTHADDVFVLCPPNGPFALYLEKQDKAVPSAFLTCQHRALRPVWKFWIARSRFLTLISMEDPQDVARSNMIDPQTFSSIRDDGRYSINTSAMSRQRLP